MGKLVSRAQYKNYEYATAVLISVGMTAFLLGSGGDKKGRLYMQKIAKKNIQEHFLHRFIDETVSFSHPLFVLESFHEIMILRIHISRK